MKLHRLMFVLPNSFTVSSIICGFYAITLCSGAATPDQLYGAAIAILFGIFLDGLDGRVARLTRTQSDFGVQLDSLADVISFGVAPALLIYKWALVPLGFTGLLLAVSFAICGALRLARFNVITQRKIPGSSRFFTGLPIPLAAGMLISVVIAYHHAGMTNVQSPVPIAFLVGLLAFLMVSNIHYRTFKDVRLSKKSATIFFVVVLAGIAVATQMRPSFVLVAYFSAYLSLGIAEEVLLFRKRRAETGANHPSSSNDGLSEDDDDEEENDEEYV